MSLFFSLVTHFSLILSFYEAKQPTKSLKGFSTSVIELSLFHSVHSIFLPAGIHLTRAPSSGPKKLIIERCFQTCYCHLVGTTIQQMLNGQHRLAAWERPREKDNFQQAYTGPWSKANQTRDSGSHPFPFPSLKRYMACHVFLKIWQVNKSKIAT